MIEIIVAFLMGFGISGLVGYWLARGVIKELKGKIKKYELNEKMWRMTR